jgi:hypothetical protein
MYKKSWLRKVMERDSLESKVYGYIGKFIDVV